MQANDIIIKSANWQTDREELSTIRRIVFIEEQNVPVDLEWDEFDESSFHFLILLDDKIIACARLTQDGKVGRMAVLKQFRKKNIGKRLLEFVVQIAREKGIKKLYLHAQVSAVSFYEKQKFTAIGNVFYEANIAHRKMEKKI